MIAQREAPANFLSWTVKQISNGRYAVAATTNGQDYDFVGNFQSIKDAHRAGRQYMTDIRHGVHNSGRIGVRVA